MVYHLVSVMRTRKNRLIFSQRRLYGTLRPLCDGLEGAAKEEWESGGTMGLGCAHHYKDVPAPINPEDPPVRP